MKFKIWFVLLGLVIILSQISNVSAQTYLLDVNVTYNNNFSTSDTDDGVVFRVANNDLFLYKITKSPTSTAQKCSVYNNATGTLLTSQNFNGDVCIVSTTLSAGTSYRFSANATGTRRYTYSNPNDPVYLFGNFSGGCGGGGCSAPSTTIYNIQSIRVYNSSTPIEINLYNPTNNTAFISGNISFLANVTSPNSNLTNSTLLVWKSDHSLFNSSTLNLTQRINISNFSMAIPSQIGFYKWNIRACNINNTCWLSDSNFSFTSANFTESYSQNITVGQSANLGLNITFSNIDTDILAHLVWNNTVYPSSKTIVDSSTVNFATNFVVPTGTGNQTGIPINHYWRFWLPDNSINSTTDIRSQNVFTLGIDKCTVFSDLFLNYSLYDEDEVTLIPNNQNITIEAQVVIKSLTNGTIISSAGLSFNSTANAVICLSEIDSGLLVDVQTKYTANDYVVEFYNIQNSTLSSSNYPRNVSLYSLLTTRSQEFLVTFKDSSFTPLENALITVTRKYVGEDLFRTVEAPLTNADGQAITHLVLGDEIYTIIVSQYGRILAVFDNIVPFCSNLATGDCSINLNAFSTGQEPTDFETYNNLAYNFQFNKTSRNIDVSFISLDSSIATINVTSTLFNGRGNNTLCSSQVQASAGTISCSIPSSYGNSTVRTNLYSNGNFITSEIFDFTDSSSTSFGGTGIIMMLLLYITIPLMMISSSIGIVIGAILGFLFAIILNLYSGGTLIGVSSTIIWFIIAGGVILWKINSLRER